MNATSTSGSTSHSITRTSTVRTKSSGKDGSTSTGTGTLGRWKNKDNFLYKHNSRHHGYDNEKAPYPVSYDKQVLELESLDNQLAMFLRNGSVSFVDYTSREQPERVLDLGCGMGTWIIDAAEEWPHCEFVGFDLVNIQIPLAALKPTVANRVSWVHGNFLTTKLPFEDDEFDHVHVQSISKGVPENKWDILFEELARVLRPGGSIEIMEDDVLFPSLPRWFTGPLRLRPRRTESVHLPDGSSHRVGSASSAPHTTPSDIPTHDHALLDSLYISVFEHRFVNIKPSAILPSYVSTYFRQVTCCPVISFPMPPVPPPQPLPPPIITSYGAGDPSSEMLDPRASTLITSGSSLRSPSLSFSSTLSAGSTLTTSSVGSRAKSHSFSSTEKRTKRPSSAGAVLDGFIDEEPPAQAVFPSLEGVAQTVQSRLYMLDNSLDEVIPGVPIKALSESQLQKLNERSLAMHLYRSYQCVLACQEAMWEELKDRLRNRRQELQPFGWDDDDELEELQSRKRFERLVERYRSDMQTRVSLWFSLNDIGWLFPPRDPLSKAEIIEEERIRNAMLEARRYCQPDDLMKPSRSLRVIIGWKL